MSPEKVKEVSASASQLQQLTSDLGIEPELTGGQNSAKAIFSFGVITVNVWIDGLTQLQGAEISGELSEGSKYALIVRLPKYPTEFREMCSVDPERLGDWTPLLRLHEFRNEAINIPEVWGGEINKNLPQNLAEQLAKKLRANNQVRSLAEWQEIARKRAMDQIKKYPYGEDMNLFEAIKKCFSAEQLEFTWTSRHYGETGTPTLFGRTGEQEFQMKLRRDDTEALTTARNSGPLGKIPEKDFTRLVCELFEKTLGRTKKVVAEAKEAIGEMKDSKLIATPIDNSELARLKAEADQAEQDLTDLIEEAEKTIKANLAKTNANLVEIEALVASVRQYDDFKLSDKIRQPASFADYYWTQGRLAEAKQEAEKALREIGEENVKKAFSNKLEKAFKSLLCPLCGNNFNDDQCTEDHFEIIHECLQWEMENGDYLTTNVAELRVPNGQLLAKIRVSTGGRNLRWGDVFVRRISQFDNDCPNRWDGSSFDGEPILVDLGRIKKIGEKKENIPTAIVSDHGPAMKKTEKENGFSLADLKAKFSK
jgi:hypothetical protein